MNVTIHHAPLVADRYLSQQNTAQTEVLSRLRGILFCYGI
jgi:hypothetical protein